MGCRIYYLKVNVGQQSRAVKVKDRDGADKEEWRHYELLKKQYDEMVTVEKVVRLEKI